MEEVAVQAAGFLTKFTETTYDLGAREGRTQAIIASDGRVLGVKQTNSAPGPDGVSYADLRRTDPGCHVLAFLFNACLRVGVVPRCWKSSNTLLLHMKRERSDIGNWRPIAMGQTTPKSFTVVVVDCLTKWADANQRLSPSQKGFLPYEGCYEHNFVLQEILKDAKVREREVVVA